MRRGVFDLRLETVSSVMRLLLAAVVASAVTAIVGAWNVTILSGLDGTSYVRAWVIFFVGDALGMVAVAPPLLVWIGSRVSFQALARRVEFAALLASTLCVGALIFTQTHWPVHLMLPVAYLTFPLMVWGAFQFGQPGVTAVSTLLGILALAGSAHGLGPFGQVGNRGEAMLLAAFMNVVIGDGADRRRSGPGARAGPVGTSHDRGAVPRVHAVLAGHRLHEVARRPVCVRQRSVGSAVQHPAAGRDWQDRCRALARQDGGAVPRERPAGVPARRADRSHPDG